MSEQTRSRRFDDKDRHDMKTVKERVMYLLERFPEARNSDFYLLILYFRYFTELGKYISFIPFSVIKKYDGVFESVRRARQYIQNDLGLYPPTDPEVIKKRRLKQKKMREMFGKGEL